MSLRGSPTDPTQNPKKKSLNLAILELTQEIEQKESRLFKLTWSIYADTLKAFLIVGALILFNIVMIKGVYSLGEEWFGLLPRSYMLLTITSIIGLTSSLATLRMAKELEKRNLLVADFDLLKERRRAAKHELSFLRAELKRELHKAHTE